jgi:hypothetical protein
MGCLLSELAPGVAPPHVRFQRRVRDKRGDFEGGMEHGSSGGPGTRCASRDSHKRNIGIIPTALVGAAV